MKSILTILLVLPLPLVVQSGCASTVGPVDSPEIDRLLAASIGIDPSDILDKGRATWFASYVDQPPPRSLYSNPDPGITFEGVLVCTSTGLFFQVWKKEVERYGTLLRLEYGEISVAELVEDGVVLHIGGRDHKTYLFFIGGAFVDRENTRQIRDLVAARLRTE